MLPQQQLLDLGLAPDLASLRRQLVVAAEGLGFGLVAAVLVRGDLASGRAWLKKVDNTPAAYNDAQNSLDDTLRDPVMTALRSGPQPVLYDQATYVQAGVADLWDLQAAYGYRCGVAASVHEPGHLEQFMLGIDRPEALPADLVGRMRLQAAVQLLTMHAQAAMQRLLTPAAAPGEALAQAELECLRWAQAGYSVWQTGDRLAITSAAVKRHRASARRKLGASSTPAAVLRCIEGGLIDG